MNKLIRVTEPLNYFSEPWKLGWYAKKGKAYCNKVQRDAMRVGTMVDEKIKENPLFLHPFKVPKKEFEVISCLEAYKKWINTYKPKQIVAGERLYGSIEGMEVTGEPDIFVDGVLVDIKCASKISQSYWVQVNTYRKLQEDNGKVGVLRLDKTTGSFEYVVKDYDESLVNVWSGLARAMVYFKGEEDGTELSEVNGQEGVA